MARRNELTYSEKLARRDTRASNRKLSLYALLFAVLVTAVLRFIPVGNLALYPFFLLGTWFHEMGHGLTALICGGHFQELEIFQNGSGIARTAIPAESPWIGAAVSAGGLLGPPIAGASLILFGRWPKTSKIGLILLMLVIVASLILWVRGNTGIIVLGVIAAGLALVSWRAGEEISTFVVQFLGAQAALSTWMQLDYLFTASATVNGQEMLSDTGSIAQQLGFSHTFWGIVIGALSAMILLLTFWLAYRR